MVGLRIKDAKQFEIWERGEFSTLSRSDLSADNPPVFEKSFTVSSPEMTGTRFFQTNTSMIREFLFLRVSSL